MRHRRTQNKTRECRFRFSGPDEKLTKVTFLQGARLHSFHRRSAIAKQEDRRTLHNANSRQIQRHGHGPDG
jgi:hypothetical protein